MRILLWFCCGAFAASNAIADSTVVFNEIMYHPASNESALEWVELHNQMAVDMDVSGWSIQGGIDYQFAEGTVIAGGDFLVVAVSPSALRAVTGLTNIYGPFSGRLSNSGETLELRNNNQRLMDSVSYADDGDWPVAPDGSGVSIAKRRPELSSAPAENWTVSSEIGGTPGAMNFPLPGSNTVAILIPLTGVWRFNSSGTTPGTAWNRPEFDSAGWPAGNGLFYAGNPEGTSGDVQPIRTLFNSGLDSSQHRLAGGAPDPHFVLTVSAQGTPPPPPVPALAIDNHPAWLANDANSGWIGPVNPGTANVAAGRYNYRTTFDLSNYDPATARINFRVACDNRVTNVFLNGASLGIQYAEFTSFSPTYTWTNGFSPGTNTLDFFTVNDTTAPNPAGFRTEISGTAFVPLPKNTSLVAGPITSYFRTAFNFNGDPAALELSLRALVDDGAVFYLNGVEVARLNLPPGLIDGSTCAVSNVTNGTLTSPIALSAQALVPGTNILAVEVHQGANGTNDMLFGLELSGTTVPPRRPPLAFNEIAGSTSNVFRVELVNFGSNTLSLDGYIIAIAGGFSGSYTFPAGTAVAGGDFISLSASSLGFQAASGDKLFLFSPGRRNLLDAVVVKKGGRGRFPDGSGPWFYSTSATFGTSNVIAFRREIVINEIMYHHQPIQSSPLIQESSEAWIELFNRSGSVVDLTGWELKGGVDYAFAPGTLVSPGGFLVVAKDRDALQALYPGVPIVGNLTNNLSRHSDLILLRDENKNPVNQVTYFDELPWPSYADGGGSSLELMDPRADNSKAEAWRASDESGKSQWQAYSYQGIATANVGPTLWNEFVLGLLGEGEALIDDVSVVENPSSAPKELIQNGSFQAGSTAWRMLGTHSRSSVVLDPDNAANQVLHLVATGAAEHMHNHIETTLANGASIVNGREYRISFRARWLAGTPQLHTRLYFNRLPRTTLLAVPMLNGTPGAPNSRRMTNPGPTFDALRHEPIVPGAGEAVTVSVTANDPDGVASCTLWWSGDGVAWAQTPMASTDSSHFSAAIPGRPASSIVQFYIEAVDLLGSKASYPAAGRASRALYAVSDGLAVPPQLHTLRIIMPASDANLLHAVTNVMSNDPQGATVIYDEREIFYDAKVHLQGSERGRPENNRVGFTLYFPADHLFRGVHPSISLDRSGGWSGRGGRQDEIVLKHAINHAGALPGMYDDIVHLIAPKPEHTGNALLLMAKYGDEFLSTQYLNGADGNVFKFELIYYPLSTVDGAVQSPKLPQPDDVIGTDLRDLGSNPENYRWNLLLENNHRDDDYSRMMQVAKTFGLSGTALDTQSRQLLDVDEWMRAFAFRSLSGDADTYGFGYPHNFMIYFRPEDGKALAFIWDMDYAWAASPTGPLLPGDNIGKLVRLPGNQRLFYGHLLDLITTTFNPGYLRRWTGHYGALAGQDYSGVLDFISQRANFVRTQLPAQIPFSITTSNGQNFLTSTPTVILGGNAWIDVKEIRLEGGPSPVTFTWPALQQWQVILPVILGTNQFKVVAYDFHGNVVGTDQITVTSTTSGGVDSDADGIPDLWEQMSGLNPFDPADAIWDFDGDGMNNREEYFAGTDPWDSKSNLHLELTAASASALQIRFEAMPGRSYSVQYRDGLDQGTWTSLTNVPPQLSNSWFQLDQPMSNPSRARFYRLVVPGG